MTVGMILTIDSRKDQRCKSKSLVHFLIQHCSEHLRGTQVCQHVDTNVVPRQAPTTDPNTGVAELGLKFTQVCSAAPFPTPRQFSIIDFRFRIWSRYQARSLRWAYNQHGCRGTNTSS